MSLASRRARAGLSVLAVSALALAACGADDAGSGDTSAGDGSADFGDITLQLSWIFNEEFAGEYIADTEGYFTEAGFSSVNLVPGPSTGVAELLGGTADIALSDSVAIGTAIANQDAPLTMIGATFQANPFTILSLADGGDIATAADLVGKRIGVQDSNTSLFNALMAANGIDPSDVEIVPVQYDPAPLVNGEVDGFVAYITNEAITLDLMGLDTTNLPFADNGLPFVAETVSVTRETLENERDMLKAFLVAEIRGWTEAVADAQRGADLALEVYGIDLDLDPEKTLLGSEAQNILVTSAETEENGLFTVSEELQTMTIESLAGAGIEVTAEELFDMSLLAEVYDENPELVDYQG
ncbi:ABC transporter substrate-binding protein [Microbacterium amylolyticum]|uniref:Thiamine pyrimidine synthase n=1 Tax=Microbacterium amylolyticum TaxID=936337 RepID=A0ABS4ZGR0_9MICO|nr:ABC transporter substrate-binding protein [Microbacterium amylolyticum]MBP2436465.1 ABC-type nitrate/sulfonate/bicarbonate transport system substrate-binding protein [Microbacterium amylolyticum]